MDNAYDYDIGVTPAALTMLWFNTANGFKEQLKRNESNKNDSLVFVVFDICTNYLNSVN